MDTIDELDLISKKITVSMNRHQCDVQHEVPAVFFSTGGATLVTFTMNSMMGFCPCTSLPNISTRRLCSSFLNFTIGWLMKYFRHTFTSLGLSTEAYYGEPAKKLGLKYIGYQIFTKESSLYDKYGKDDPVLKDPRSLIGAYDYSIDKMNQQQTSDLQSH
ncbi:hypothetical protein M0R45_030554 [Rubus argutus]|uniref:Uncharacterized protein n=1 Tax=Rubus argutus TaxID=59490 RepID=A0AAW1WBW7_RUBAR